MTAADLTTLNQRKELLDRLFQDLERWCQAWGLPQLPHQIEIKFSHRLRRAVGRCHTRKRRITLSGLLLLAENQALLTETLCHEVAHLAAYHLHGSRIKPHGREWKSLLKAAGFEPQATVRAEKVHGLEALLATRQQRYEYRCPVCQVAHVLRAKNSRFRCRACRQAGRPGHLHITKL
jgi:SprT protein